MIFFYLKKLWLFIFHNFFIKKIWLFVVILRDYFCWGKVWCTDWAMTQNFIYVGSVHFGYFPFQLDEMMRWEKEPNKVHECVSWANDDVCAINQMQRLGNWMYIYIYIYIHNNRLCSCHAIHSTQGCMHAIWSPPKG
jgi:hypothetical protein